MHNSILRTKRETKRDKALWWKVMYKQLCMWWKRDHLKLFAAQGQQSKLEDLPRGITYNTVKAPKKKKTPNSRTKRRKLRRTKREDWQTRNTKAQYQDPEEEANDAANTYDAGDDASKNLPVDEQRRRFSVINLQHVRKAIQQRLDDDTSRRTREAVAPQRPRSVRKKTNQSWSNPG